MGQLRRPRLDGQRHRAVGPADGPDRGRRQPVLQGLLPRDARPAPAHHRRRALERAVRHRARRREHVHVVPLRDRRTSPPAVDRRARRLPLREHEGVAVLPRRRRPRPATARPAARHRSPRGVRPLVERHVSRQVPAPRRRRAAVRGDAVLRPDPRRAPRGPGHVRHGPGAVSRAASSRRRAATLPGRREPDGFVGTDWPGRSPRAATVGDELVAGQGVGLHALADALAAAIDEHYEPSWDRTRGEFTWGFQLEEPHPRGQYNGTMAAAQVATERAWWRLANVGPDRGSPSRPSSTSTSRPSRSARRGGTASAAFSR